MTRNVYREEQNYGKANKNSGTETEKEFTGV